MEQKKGSLMRNQEGFTLIEIIAVLVLLGILAAVAVPKYMDLQDSARTSAAQGQIAEVKGRLATALGGYMLANTGNKPADGAAFVTYANTLKANSCPTTATVEGDFEFSCTGAAAAQSVTITVSKVQGKNLAAAVTATYSFAD